MGKAGINLLVPTLNAMFTVPAWYTTRVMGARSRILALYPITKNRKNINSCHEEGQRFVQLVTNYIFFTVLGSFS